MLNDSIVILVENPECTSGEPVRGRVHLTIDDDENVQNLRGIRLVLEGYERTTLAQVVETSCVLVKTEHALVTFGADETPQVQPGQSYEFPFEWLVPPGLPSSLLYAHTNTRNECDTGRVSYVLSAYVVGSQPIMRANSPLIVASDAVLDPPHSQPIRVDQVVFPIKTALVWKQGDLRFGWEADRDVVTPGSTITVRVIGESEVAVQDFLVRLVETVTLQTKESSRTFTRILASEKLLVDSTVWGPDTPPVELHVPTDCSKTYRGSLLQIQHSLVVIAETAKDKTTNPKLEAPVCVVRGRDHMRLASSPGTTTTTTTSDDYVPMAKVESVPGEATDTSSEQMDGAQSEEADIAVPAIE
jgi:hypothetical protein